MTDQETIWTSKTNSKSHPKRYVTNRRWFFYCLCCFVILSKSEVRSENVDCTTFRDCDSCISNPACAWCKDPTMEIKCNTIQWFQKDSNCGKNYLENPMNEITIIQDDELTSSTETGSTSQSGGSSSTNRFVQISPQRIRMKLRRGQEAKFVFRIAQAKQYPVDLYYLMDLSNSMSDDKKNIVKLGQKLANTIQSITEDFQIGFGSFVDKELMPYISLVPEDNCQSKGCPGPYSFQHQMSLSPDARLFTERVKKAPISGNIDNPEGGFDALLQVMVCEKEVGWRSQARRVIVFTTDQSFHIACDGKLGGVVRPNDGHCHLNSSGFYTYSTKQDYPSVGHINHVAKEHSVNIIWAVTADKFWLYKDLEGVISGSTAGIISADSSNVVELVRQQYEAITTTIRAETNASSNCNAKITTRCHDRTTDGPPECENIELGSAVEMTLSVTLNECQAETFGVYPIGLNEQLIVEVEPLCECPCHDEKELEEDLLCQDPLCNVHGHMVCGVCKCCGDFFGPNCECANVLIDMNDPDKTCRPNGTKADSPVCSGRGRCDCGSCVCNTQREGVRLTGDFCETVCDNTACDIDSQGQLCSGHGQCLCEFCKCEPPWTGSACECRKEPDKCRAPDTPNLICSGNGECPCDKCICNEDGYSGVFCEVCATCSDKCAKLRPCVECKAFSDPHLMLSQNTNDTTKDDKSLYEEALERCRSECLFYYEEEIPSNIPDDWNNCTFKYKNCDYTFSHSVYRPGKNLPEYIYLNLLENNEDEDLPPEKRKMRCPPEPDLIGIILGVIGCIVFVGLVTILLWKALTTVHDRREFARFEAERQNIKMPSHSNPIFKQATTTVQNPTFNSPKYY